MCITRCELDDLLEKFVEDTGKWVVDASLAEFVDWFDLQDDAAPSNYRVHADEVVTCPTCGSNNIAYNGDKTQYRCIFCGEYGQVKSPPRG